MLIVLWNVIHSQKGQGMVEYGLIIALVAVLLIGGLTALQGGISTTFTSATTSL